MKKYLIVLVGLFLLVVASCNVERPEIIIEQDQTEEHHLAVNINITRGDIPGTKALKQDWEEGDKVYFFFDKETDMECLYLTYKNGSWDPYWTKRIYSLEETIAARQSGTMTGLYVFYNKSTKHGYWGDPDYRDVEFYADDVNTQQVKAYTWFLTCIDASYQVVNGVLEANVVLSLPTEYDFVQFYVPSLNAEPGLFTLKTDPVISSVSPYRYHRDNGIIAEPHPANLMPGYPYASGMVFYGVVPANLKDVQSDYTFTLTDTSSDAAFTYSVSSKTLSRGKAINLPNITNWTPVIDDSDSYVDLGLPSGLKWATMNLGANSPDAFGDTYAWGHTTPGYVGSWSDYSFYSSGSTDEDVTFTKYFATGSDNVILDLEDDAANVQLGGCWRMPSVYEWYELLTYCDIEKETIGYTEGYRVTSKVSGYTGKSIFLPAGQSDFYWSSMLSSFDSKYAQFFYPKEKTCSNVSRKSGNYIRPVYDESLNPGGVTVASKAMCEINGQTLYVAEKNLGASSPEDPGKYYAWGETTGYTTSDNHIFGYQFYTFTANDSYEVFSKYVYDTETQHWGGAGSPDNLTHLQAADDAATAALGGGWHMPSADEIWALIEQCDWAWDSGRNGYVVSGRYQYSGNSIFLPAGGSCYGRIYADLSDVGVEGCYWGSDLSTASQYNDGSPWARMISFASDHIYHSSTTRYAGANIRPVKKQ